MVDIPRPALSRDGELYIHPADQITYREAQDITGRSHSYLRQRVARGQLTRVGGQPRDSVRTRLSRYECEDLALADYRASRRSAYWLTMREAAARLGIARQNAYAARTAGRLPVFEAANGALLVRRTDVEALLLLGRFKERTWGAADSAT